VALRASAEDAGPLWGGYQKNLSVFCGGAKRRLRYQRSWFLASVLVLGSRFRRVAKQAFQLGAKVRRAALRRRDPHADLPRRIVSDVLRMPALELGHPVAFLVLMVTDDRAAQRSLGSLGRSIAKASPAR